MSRSFISIAQQPFIGAIAPQAAQTFNAKFGGQPPLPPVTVECNINWLSYGAGIQSNVNILADLRNASATQGIDQILSVRIDNLGNPVPVYVYFPDTEYTIVAPPNTVVWEPAQTGQFAAWIVGEGFTVGTVGSTKVYFCNFRVNPFIDYEFPQTAMLSLASATISRGASIFNQNYGTPALGDQIVNYSNVGVAANAVFQNNIMGSPYTSGFLYITHVHIGVSLAVNSQSLNWVIESAGSAGILLNFQPQTNTLTPYLTMISLSSLNIKLDATQTYRLRQIAGGGGNPSYMHTFGFTINPN